MAELTPKDKVELAFIYELNEYKSLKKLLTNERLEIATKLLLVEPSDTVTVAKLQGRAEALKQLNLKLKEIHAQDMKR